MAPERNSGDFGPRLREARERKGVSLRAIANVTRISVAVLDALERNDISRLPGGIFSRAFVRSYATEVGLDPETTVEEFVRQFPHESVTVGHPASTQVDEIDSFDSNRRAMSLGVRLALFSVPIAALVIYFGMPVGPFRGATPAPPTLGTVAVNPQTVVAGIDATGRARLLRVEVVAILAGRMSSATDGQSAVDIPLIPGARRLFEADHELLMTFSDAAAVEVTINGAPARPFGTPGEAATLPLTTDNYRAYLVAR